MIGPISKFVESPRFFVSGMKSTPHSTVVVHGQKRAIFKLESEEDKGFLDHLRTRLTELDELGFSRWINAIMVGHIAADRWPEHSGKCTEEVLQRFQSGSCYKFANFGGSQIQFGYERWKGQLQSMDCFEANLAEMQQLATTPENSKPSLAEIIERLLRDNITALITLDRFGAVGTFKGDSRHIVMAWPFDLQNIVDTTGVGDAFGAGVVANAISGKHSSIYDFREVIDQARFWAAKACLHLGGSFECPTKTDLENYSKEILKKEIPSDVKVMELREAFDILRILDRAYS